MIANRTDMAVIKPFRLRSVEPWRFTIWHGVALVVALIVAVGIGEAQAAAADKPGIIATILKWTPLLAQGFALNIAMSFLAMAIGTVIGVPLGLAQISLLPPVRAGSWFVTQFFRNSPWLVLLFYCMLLLPFEVNIGGTIVPLPGWLKSTIGLSLPVMANVSELVRGAVRSIPFGQWEAAESVAMSREQTLRMVILPQCVKRMTPPWMNLYAILTVATAPFVVRDLVGRGPARVRRLELMGTGEDPADEVCSYFGDVVAAPGLEEAVCDRIWRCLQAERASWDAQTWTEYGVTLRLAGKFAEARSAYEHAIAVNPAYAPAHRNLGVLLDLFLDDSVTAQSELETYKTLTGEDKPVSGWIAELRSRNRVPGKPAQAAPAEPAPTETPPTDPGAAPQPQGG